MTTSDAIDEHLYRIGLMIRPLRPGLTQRRRLIHHPVMMLLIIFAMIFIRTMCMITKNERTLTMLGDIGHFFGIRFHHNLLIVLLDSFVPISQIIYYISHRRGVKPTFLKPFQVLFGMANPLVLGLKLKDVTRLKFLSRKYFAILRFNCDYGITSSCFVLIVALYAINTSLSTTLLYGVPAAIHLTLTGHYFWNVLGYQFLYFYLVCKYLIMKFVSLNCQVASSRDSKHQGMMMNMIRSFTRVCQEIQDYDESYFSKFLFISCFLYSSAIVIFLNIEIFSDVPFTLKIVIFYIMIIQVSIFLITIMTAASVNYHAKKMYCHLNSLFISYLNYPSIDDMNHHLLMIKMITLIERIAK